jgi:hypothetical protein
VLDDGIECGEVCGFAGCSDACNRPKGHEGYHLTADDICAWTADRTWAGPADPERVRDGD